MNFIFTIFVKGYYKNCMACTVTGFKPICAAVGQIMSSAAKFRKFGTNFLFEARVRTKYFKNFKKNIFWFIN